MQRWHLAVKSSTGPYDLSRINETILERTRTKVYWYERDKKDNERLLLFILMLYYSRESPISMFMYFL